MQSSVCSKIGQFVQNILESQGSEPPILPLYIKEVLKHKFNLQLGFREGVVFCQTDSGGKHFKKVGTEHGNAKNNKIALHVKENFTNSVLLEQRNTKKFAVNTAEGKKTN